MKASALVSRAAVGMGLAGAVACGAPAPPPVAPTAPALPVPAKPVVDVHALEARFLADGFTMVVGADDAGRITTVSTRKSVGDRSAAKDVTTVAHATQWLRTYGDAFGYGRLGPATPETAEAQPTINQLVRVMLRYPGAEGCPDLVVAATYTNSEAMRLPAFVELFCPTAPGGPERLARLREGMSESEPTAPASPPPPPPAQATDDPVAIWLRGEGYVIASVVRRDGTLSVELVRKATDSSVERRALATRLARGVARAAGLPALDVATESSFNKPKPSLRSLSMRQSSPPEDGACIDPEVTVTLGEAFDTRADAGHWAAEVHVTCDHEPSTGPRPPADTARPLPATARRGVPYLAVCTSVNFAWGYHNGGLVIDKRGDVYAFSGGRPLAGKSMRELAILARHGRTYVGSLPPADVDRLSNLTATVKREPLVRTPTNAADRGGGGCRVLEGGTGGALGSIQLDSYGSDHDARRTGPAATEIATLLGRAHTLAARGN
jgi:hypothetical protein